VSASTIIEAAQVPFMSDPPLYGPIQSASEGYVEPGPPALLAAFATERRWEQPLQRPIVAACAEGYVERMKQDIASGFTAARRVVAALARVLIGGALVLGSAGAAAAESNDPSAAAAPEYAKWAPRKLNFTYVAFTTHYSCDGLQQQVKAILQQLGARDDLVVKSRGCTRFEGPETFPGVEATFSVLEPTMTVEKGAGHSQNVPAHWDTVTIDSDTTRRTNSGGCELIEQVKKSILPLFATRDVKFSSDCFPRTTSLHGARLSAEVLLPVKAKPPPAAQR
jgi:hypothetical protein